jgi:transposase
MPKPEKKPRRKYDREFKAEAVRLVLEGRPAAEVAADLGISAGLLYRWKSKALGEGAVPATAGMVSEAESLRLRLREVERERDILKKALGIFSRES